MTSWVVTLVSPREGDLTSEYIKKAQSLIGEESKIHWLADHKACDISFENAPNKTSLEMKIRAALPMIDVAIQPSENRRKKLLVADMDSTMIQLESLDYLADILGFGEEVTEITNRGMRGELDFAESLRSRVALLKGQPASAMAKVLENIPYTEGGEITVKTMVKNDCYCALVSGGFTFTTDIVAPKLGFHEARANQLEIKDGLLTGEVIEPILARDSKQHTLEELSDKFGISNEHTCCIGDGANDLDMIRASGMGVGYHAKPIVIEEADLNIQHGDMTTLLYYQGYTKDEFVNLT